MLLGVGYLLVYCVAERVKSAGVNLYLRVCVKNTLRGYPFNTLIFLTLNGEI